MEQPPWLKGHRIKKGEVKNPHGAGITPKELKSVKRLTQKELADMASFLLNNDVYTLRSIAATERGHNYWMSAFASVAVKAYEKGDMTTINLMLDRIIGKVKDTVEVQLPRPTIIQIEQDRQIVLGATFKNMDEKPDDFQAPPPGEAPGNDNAVQVNPIEPLEPASE